MLTAITILVALDRRLHRAERIRSPNPRVRRPLRDEVPSIPLPRHRHNEKLQA
jgi:hypothetical protein